MKKYTRLLAGLLALALLLSIAPLTVLAEDTPTEPSTETTTATTEPPADSTETTAATTDPPTTTEPAKQTTPTNPASAVNLDGGEDEEGEEDNKDRPVWPNNEDDEGHIATIAEGGDPYDDFTGNVGSADKKTYNVFVGVGRGMTIGKFNGQTFVPDSLDITGLDTTLAMLEATTYGTGLNGLRLRGLKEGVTSFKIGSDTYTLYVVPGMSAYAQNSKTVEINVKDIINCTSYYSINGGELKKIDDKGYLVNQTFVGGFQICFFTAPDKGYALTEMNITGTSGQYYSLGDGTRKDGSDSEAWPLNNPDAVDANDEKGWKTDRLNQTHGYKTPLTTRNFMTVSDLRKLYTKALELHCDGTAQFGRYGSHTQAVEITFAAEKLPTLQKSISRYKKNATDEWQIYDPDATTQPDLRLGSQLEYTFTIQRAGTQNVVYTDVMLSDDQIGYKLLLTYDPETKMMVGYVGGEQKDKADISWETGSTEMKITTEYTISEKDLSKYSGGQFKNSATLSYNYKSAYSAGVYSVSQSSSATCKIYGLATCQWAENVPQAIRDKFTCPDSHEFLANDSATVRGDQLKDASMVLCNNGKWQKWTFQGWNLKEENQPDTLYAPGATITLTNYNSKNATLVGHWQSTDLSPHTVTYQWSGLPSGRYVLPTDSKKYYETQAYTVDSKYAKGTQEEIDSKIYTFSGWMLEENKVITGAQTMGDTNIVLKGKWKSEDDLVRLTISTEDWNSVDENQRFLFRVTGNDLDMVVSVPGNGSTTISGLWADNTYTVTELTDWAWRYEPVKSDSDKTTQKSQSIRLSQTETNEVTFHHNRPKKQWLDGNAFKDIFKKTQEGA